MNGQYTTVNRCLGELHTTLEEAKADVLAAYWLLWRNDQRSDVDLTSILASYLPGIVRAMRFGQAQAHGRSNMLQFNYLTQCGAIRLTKHQLSSIWLPLLAEGLGSLAREILLIQSSGDFAAAKQLVDAYCRPTDTTQAVLQKLESLPIDITVNFTGV